jgi:hypothetical protein
MLKPTNDYQWLMSDYAFPRLEMLRLDAADITNSALGLGAGRMESLKRLELRACEGVSGNGILKFAEGRNQDFELPIDACPGVQDIAKLTKIVKYFEERGAFIHGTHFQFFQVSQYRLRSINSTNSDR